MCGLLRWINLPGWFPARCRWDADLSHHCARRNEHNALWDKRQWIDGGGSGEYNRKSRCFLTTIRSGYALRLSPCNQHNVHGHQQQGADLWALCPPWDSRIYRSSKVGERSRSMMISRAREVWATSGSNQQNRRRVFLVFHKAESDSRAFSSCLKFSVAPRRFRRF